MITNQQPATTPAPPTPSTCGACPPRGDGLICPVTGTGDCPPNTTKDRAKCSAC